MGSGIYVIDNYEEDKVYVGQSVNIEKRWRRHLGDLRRGNHPNRYMQRTYDKYGEGVFGLYVIEYCSEEELNEKEIYHIERLGSVSSENGYNMRLGGNSGGFIVDPETLLNMSNKTIEYFEDPENRIRHMYRCSTLSKDEIYELKIRLYNNESVKDIADIMNISEGIVSHTKNLKSYSMALPEYNYYIFHRETIYEKRRISQCLQLYREGFTYSDIAVFVDRDQRTVIRMIMNNRTEFDLIMRERKRQFNEGKRYRIIKKYYDRGYGIRDISKKFQVSTATIIKWIREDDWGKRVKGIPALSFTNNEPFTEFNEKYKTITVPHSDRINYHS